MKLITKPRGKGKTTELIKISAETGDYIVVLNHRLARFVAQMATDMGLQIPFPATYAEILDKRCKGMRISGLLLDDLDSFLSGFLEARVNAVTMSVLENNETL